MKCVLTIAGADPTNGAGVGSDVLTLYQHGVFPLSIITSITCQNTHGVSLRKDLDALLVRNQLLTLLATHKPDAIKIGMLGSSAITKTVYDLLKDYKKKSPVIVSIVLDPVIAASSGKKLLSDEGVHFIKTTFLSELTLLTPNANEFEALFNLKINENSLKRTLEHFRPPCAVLIKGGHLEKSCTDILIEPSGKVTYFYGQRLEAAFSHGTGCTLSSAIAANLAKGSSLKEAIGKGKIYLRRGLSNPIAFSFPGGTIRK